MIKTVRDAWKIPELRKKILFTIFALLIFRLGAAIPVPYINSQELEVYLAAQSGTILGLMNAMSGSAFSMATVFALSIQPYINSSIIIQLLTVAIPALERLAKEGGEEGRKKIASITRYTTVAIGLIQGFGYYSLINSYGLVDTEGLPALWVGIVIVLSFTAGSAFLMWLGEQITEFGIGNGISIILFAGIVSVLVLTPFFYAGFDTIPQQAEEAAEGLNWNKFGKIISLALLAAGGFYMVCIYSFGTILDWHEFVKSPVPALACLKGINMLLYLAMLVIATLGPMGPMNSFYGATSRIMLAMGRKGQLPEKFAEVDPKSGAPKLACVVLGVITVVGPFLGKNMLIPLTNVSALAFIFSCGMVALACLRMRFTEPDLPRPYEVPGGKFGISLAIAACAIIIGLLVIPFSPASLNMVEWSIVIGWLAIGLALMAFTNSRKK